MTCFRARRFDRVLLIGVFDPELVRRIAARVPDGGVAGVGPEAEVREARRLQQDLDNVMFVPAPLDQLPWQDAFFDLAVDPGGACNDAGVKAEVLRVLRPGAPIESGVG